MDIDEYRSELINDIKAQGLAEEEYPENIFLEYYVKDILVEDYGAVSGLEIMHYEWTSNSNKYRSMYIDAAYLQPSVNTLTLVYCDYNPDQPISINNELVNSKINLLENFVSNVLKNFFDDAADSSPVTQLARDIINNIDDISKLQLVFASTNIRSDRIKRTWDLQPLEVGTKKFDVDLILIDVQNIYQSQVGGGDREKINIDTKDFGYPDGIPCIKAEVDSPDYDSYLAVVPGSFLADIYLKYNARLLESNVRSFLNTRGAVNKGIQATIQYSKTRFFAYNNGISTTADSIDVATRNGGTYITRFYNLQIINGGQTTATLTWTRLRYGVDLSGIFVQMKLSIIKNENEEDELVRLISLYANKQNKVTNADLNSNHKYYERIEKLSSTIKCPQLHGNIVETRWFFERTRGQYEQSKMVLKTKGERDRFEIQCPKEQKFTKSDLAKYLNAADEMPYYVSSGAEVNLSKFQEIIDKKWEENNAIFNEAYFKALIAKAILYKRIDKIVLHSDWYQEDRAYKSAIVPYTFSKFVHEAKKLHLSPNYQKIWNQQDVPAEYIESLEYIAYKVYQTLNDPKRTVSNIGEYAKRTACWEKIMNLDCPLTRGAQSALVDPETTKDIEIAARKDQLNTNGASDIITIFNAGVKYWEKVQDFASKVGGFTYYEMSLCSNAINYINGRTSLLSDKQTRDLIKLMSKMEDYGIKPGDK